MKIKYVIIFVMLLIAGNFLRLLIEEKNIPEIEKNNIRSNVDLEKIIGKERYAEIEDKIRFIE